MQVFLCFLKEFNFSYFLPQGHKFLSKEKVSGSEVSSKNVAESESLYSDSAKKRSYQSASPPSIPCSLI